MLSISLTNTAIYESRYLNYHVPTLKTFSSTGDAIYYRSNNNEEVTQLAKKAASGPISRRSWAVVNIQLSYI